MLIGVKLSGKVSSAILHVGDSVFDCVQFSSERAVLA